jgi:hypothetical protein
MTLYEVSGLFGNLGHVLRAAGALFGLGIVIAFSPTTLGIEIEVLEQPRASRRAVLIIAGSVGAAATLLAGVFLVVSPDTLHALWSGQVRTIASQRWFDASVGALLVMIGVARWLRSARPHRKRRSLADTLSKPRVLATVVLANTLLSTTHPATMYLVVRTIGTTRPELWLLEYAVFLAGLAAPYLLLAIAITRSPGFARRVQIVMTDLGRRDLRRPVAALLVAVGLALLVWAGVKIAWLR